MIQYLITRRGVSAVMLAGGGIAVGLLSVALATAPLTRADQTVSDLLSLALTEITNADAYLNDAVSNSNSDPGGSVGYDENWSLDHNSGLLDQQLALQDDGDSVGGGANSILSFVEKLNDISPSALAPFENDPSLLTPLHGLVDSYLGGLWIMESNDRTINDAVAANVEYIDAVSLAGSNAAMVADNAAVQVEEQSVWSAFTVDGLV